MERVNYVDKFDETMYGHIMRSDVDWVFIAISVYFEFNHETWSFNKTGVWNLDQLLYLTQIIW